MEEENEALENDPILQKLRETKCQRLFKFMKSISSCLLNPDLLILKAFCVFLYGSFGAITPYLPLYFKQYNLVPYQVGIILGLSPIIQCLVAPIWTALAGKWHAQKLVFLAGVMSVLVKLLLFLAVQPHRQFCIESYVNSTNNVTYTRSAHFSDVLKGKEEPWKANIPTASSKKVVQISTPSAPVKRDVYDAQDMDDYPDFSSVPHQSRHLMALPSAIIYDGLVSFKVMIKNSSNWDSNLNVTVTSIITGDQDEVFNIFLIFVLFVVVCDFLQASTFGLGDGSVLERLEDNFRSTPTKMHFTGSLGWAGTAMIVGAIIYGSKTIHCGSPYVAYFLAFYFSLGFVSMAFIQALWFEYKYDRTTDIGSETWKKSCKLFGTIKNSVFLICVVYVSLCAGFLNSFLNWYIDDLGGNALVMATVSATRMIVTFVFYQIAKVLVPILGKSNVSLVALMCYTTCFFCYWLAKNTWEIVGIVAIEGASFGLAWRSCDYFVSRLRTSPNVVNVTKGFLEGVFWGAGQGLGVIIGGALYGWLSGTTFLVIGVATIAILLLLLALLYYKSSREEEDDDDIDLEDYEILDDDKRKIRYDDYDDMDNDNKLQDGDEKRSKDASVANDDDVYEMMDDDDDDIRRDSDRQKSEDDGDDHKDDDDEYEEMEDRNNEHKEHDDGDYFKFASPDDKNSDRDSDNDLHKRRPEDHKQRNTEY